MIGVTPVAAEAREQGLDPLDGVAEVWGPGGTRREQPVVDLVTGELRNTLAPGELLRAIRLPDHALRSRTAFRRLSLSNLGRSGVLLVGRVDPPDAGGAFVLTVTASTRRPVQLRFAADALPTAADLVATLDAGAGSPAAEAALADVVRVAAVLEAAYESAARGGAVAVAGA